MNAFTQDDFKGAYKSASMQQLRSLADQGHAEARELLALEAVVEPVEDVKIAIEPIPVSSIITKSKGLSAWLDRMTEANYQAWVQAGRPEIY